MKLKPIIKTNNSLQKVAEWLVEKFPENYKDIDYLEPFLGDGSILLTKEKSIEEVIADKELTPIWQALRDEPKEFAARIKKLNHCKKTFEKISNNEPEDYIENSIKEFVLRKMSKEGLKKTYVALKEEVKCKDCWCDIFEQIPLIHERIKDVFIINSDPLQTIKSFNHSKCFIFCCPPNLEETNSEMHAEIGVLMHDFRGKVMIYGRNCAMYKRIYKEWNRKGLPNSKNESIWTNF